MSTQRCCGALALFALVAACQDYPFETREARKVQASRINEVVATVTPTDILFVLDNSGSMVDEVTELRNNVAIFIDELTKSANDYQVGFIVTDIDCNLPACSVANPGAPCHDCSGATNNFCCNKFAARGLSVCQDLNIDADPEVDSSNCDGGRLRSADNIDRIFERPPEDMKDPFLAAVEDTLNSLGCNGTAYEAGLEATRRAIACAVDDPDCPDPAVRDLNAGFIRTEADLVIIFLSDEDDCSFRNDTRYENIPNSASPVDQSRHLCSPNECYASYGVAIDGVEFMPADGVLDWGQRSAANPARMHCGPNPRQVNPPLPDAVQGYVDDIIRYKGGDVNKVRAAAILGVVPDDGSIPMAQPKLGHLALACEGNANVPSQQCRCWTGNITVDGIFCDVTDTLGVTTGLPNAFPASSSLDCDMNSVTLQGCQAMPGSRYLDFLQLLEDTRAAAGKPNETLVDSICRFNYQQTMINIVNSVILNDCFNLGVDITSVDEIELIYNGTHLVERPRNSPFPGFSWVAQNPSEVCLEGGLTKNIGDTVELFVLQP